MIVATDGSMVVVFHSDRHRCRFDEPKIKEYLLNNIVVTTSTLRDQAAEHPIIRALRRLSAKVPGPAMLLIVSEAQSDAEIAALVFHKVEYKYDVVDLSKNRKMTRQAKYF